MIRAALFLLLLATPLSAVAPQDTFKEQVKQYKEVIEGRDHEEDAIQMIDGFIRLYAEHNERLIEIADLLELEEGDPKVLRKEIKTIDKSQEELADLVWLAFKERKRDTEGHRNLWKVAVHAYGQMGSHGAKFLWKAYNEKRFKKDTDFQALCVQQIGYTKDYSQAEELIDLLDHHIDLLIKSAADALVQFGEAPGEVRLQCTEKLVNYLNSYYNSQLNPDDTVAQARYRLVRRSFLDALTELTKQSFQDPLEWRRWYNKNKKNKDVWSDS
ncbi:MAG: hypothetical protein HQ519_09740 [Planctomycetes bacterium]|nr:hypothetical protein [Planctomycetota bacterium]